MHGKSTTQEILLFLKQSLNESPNRETRKFPFQDHFCGHFLGDFVRSSIFVSRRNANCFKIKGTPSRKGNKKAFQDSCLAGNKWSDWETPGNLAALGDRRIPCPKNQESLYSSTTRLVMKDFLTSVSLLMIWKESSFFSLVKITFNNHLFGNFCRVPLYLSQLINLFSLRATDDIFRIDPNDSYCANLDFRHSFNSRTRLSRLS